MSRSTMPTVASSSSSPGSAAAWSTSRPRAGASKLQGAEFAETRQRLEEQARQALSAGREDLACEALTRRATIDNQLGDLGAQPAKLVDDEAELVAPVTTVIRGGSSDKVPVNDIVPGDLVLLTPGDRVPARVDSVRAAVRVLVEHPLYGDRKRDLTDR